MSELDDFINRVKRLPPAPKILPQLMQLLHKPNVDASRVTQLITYDPSLTVSILHVCNSAFYGCATQVTSIEEAITRLGFREVYRIVAAASGARALSAGQQAYGLDEGDLWKHSVTAAVAAQILAREGGDDENIVFTAALLHDIGKVVLAQAMEGAYLDLLNEVEESQQSLLDAEKKLLGVQHAEIGGRLLARWSFPPNLVAAVTCHHHPGEAKAHTKLASYVYLGNMIAYFIGHGFGHQAFAFRGRTEALSLVGLRAEQLPRYMIKTVENFEAVEALLNVEAAPA